MSSRTTAFVFVAAIYLAGCDRQKDPAMPQSSTPAAEMNAPSVTAGCLRDIEARAELRVRRALLADQVSFIGAQLQLLEQAQLHLLNQVADGRPRSTDMAAVLRARDVLRILEQELRQRRDWAEKDLRYARSIESAATYATDQWMLEAMPPR